MAAYKEHEGTIAKSYRPKRGKDKFFFEFEDGRKGMAPVALKPFVAEGARVRLTARTWKGWLYPKFAEVLDEPKAVVEVDTLRVGYVSKPKMTEAGMGSLTKTESRGWMIIPLDAVRAYFHENRFPRGGHGEMTARLKVNGNTAVTEILDWNPDSKTIEADVPLGEAVWSFDTVGFKVEGEMVWIPRAELPFPSDVGHVNIYRHLDATVRVRAKLYAYAETWKTVGWEAEEVEVEVPTGFVAQVEDVIENRRVQKATAKVRAMIREMQSQGKVLDPEMVVELFLSEGVEYDRTDAERVLEEGYDARFLRALKGLGTGRTWATFDGFLIEVGEWLVWERCRKGAATYIFPANPGTEYSEGLSVAEWAAVLGRVLPDTPKMDLRYGEIGQALAGHSMGVPFAVHATDGDDAIAGWLQVVQEVTDSAPPAEDGVPDLAALLLEAGDD